MKWWDRFDYLNKRFLIFLIVLFIGILFFTKAYGITDTGSFTSPAKYFAGEYDAKIRSSHSYIYSFINSFHVSILKSFFGFKVANLVTYFLIIISLYYISNKNKNVAVLFLVSPILWYMSPWINSIQLSSLFFLWSYYFIKVYNQEGKFKPLFYSGIFFGLAASLWHAIFFFGFFLIILFFYDKRVLDFVYYSIAILIGLMPLLILDGVLFGFPFHSLLKNTFGTISNLFSLGVYSKEVGATKNLIAYLILFLMIPIYYWKFYTKNYFKKNYRTILFITISLIIIAKNPQPRYLFLIVPIILLNLSKIISEKQVKKLIIFSLIISIIVIVPYILQVNYETNAKEVKSFLMSFPSLELNNSFSEEIISTDLLELSEKYPNEKFIVGNDPDDYEILANIYWGEDIAEFISIQDYYLYLNDTNVLVEREFRSSPSRIGDRREIWIIGGIGKPINDNTDYESLKYALCFDEELDLEGFEKIEDYELLSLWEKEG